MARQALGKGLDALIRQTQEVTNPAQTAVATGASVQKISLDKIIPNRYQPRRIFDEEKLAITNLAIDIPLLHHFAIHRKRYTMTLDIVGKL